MAEQAVVDEVVRRITAYGLRRVPLVPPTDPFGDDVWRRVLATVGSQRLTGLALAAVDGGAIPLSDEQARHLRDRHQDAMISVLGLELELLSAAETLKRRGVEFVALKGSALARTVYPDPSWRSFGDVDLLIRGRDLKAALEALGSIGYRRVLPEPRPGFDLRFGKGAVLRNGDGLELDLHRTLVAGPFGLWTDPEWLFRYATSLSIGDRTIRRFDDTGLLLHACMHAILGAPRPRLLPLRDVAQVVEAGSPDWDLLAVWAQAWRLGPVFAQAFAAVTAVLRWEPPDEAARVASGSAGRRERRALAAYSTGAATYGVKSTAAIMAIPGLRAKAAYARALLVPNRQFLAARANGGRPSYVRRWLIPIRWALRRR